MMIEANASRVLRVAVAAFWLGLATAAAAQGTKNVLVFYGNTADLPWVKAFDAALPPAN